MSRKPIDGEYCFWFHRRWGQVRCIKAFKPGGKDIGETVIETEEGVRFIARNEDLIIR